MIVKIGYPLLKYKELDYDDNFERNVILTYKKKDEKTAYKKGSNRILEEMYKNKHDFKPNIIKKDYGEYTLSEIECLLYDMNGDLLTEENLYKIAANGKMSILRININPESLEDDVETDIRYWIDNSKHLIDDKKLNNKIVLQNLEGKNLYIFLKEHSIKISNCKIIQIYRGNYKYYFALLIEKIRFFR